MSALNPRSDLHDKPLYALVLRAGAMLMLACMFASVKYLSENGVHLVESLFFRQLGALPVVLLFLMRGPGLKGIYTRHFNKHLSRSALGICGMVCFFTSYIMLPLAEATTIGFATPIFATILSALFLKEDVGMHRWTAVLAGFAGVLVITQYGAAPDTEFNILGVSIALLAALIASVISLMLRDLGRTEAPTTILFWFSALTLVPLAILLPFFIQPHSPRIWAGLAIMGLVGGFGQWLLTSALRWGPVSLVISMDYTSLIWSTLLGWLIWSTLPGAYTWIGAALICSSGIYISWREHLRLKEIRSARTLID